MEVQAVYSFELLEPSPGSRAAESFLRVHGSRWVGLSLGQTERVWDGFYSIRILKMLENWCFESCTGTGFVKVCVYVLVVICSVLCDAKRNARPDINPLITYYRRVSYLLRMHTIPYRIYLQ